VTERKLDSAPGAEPERGFLLAVLDRSAEEAEIAELGELAHAAGGEREGEETMRGLRSRGHDLAGPQGVLRGRRR